jgi:acetoin utilization protein AcuB
METNRSRDVAAPTVEEDAHLAAAVYLMKHGGAPALVVLQDEDSTRQVGMITEAELAEAKADGMDVDEMRVRDVMTPD